MPACVLTSGMDICVHHPYVYVLVGVDDMVNAGVYCCLLPPLLA